MGPFEIGFVAVVGAFGYAFYENYTKTKIKMNSANQSNDETKQQLEQLKQRVATLEAIVTDKSYQLKNEINKL
jgi:cell division protein FtsB